MQVTFLETGASEGIPSMHCKCRVCENARRLKGKEIRTRMGVLIDDALMIDLSPDAFINSVRYEIDYSKMKHLLITHSHSDHFYADDVAPNIVGEQNETFASAKPVWNKRKSTAHIRVTSSYLRIKFPERLTNG